MTDFTKPVQTRSGLPVTIITTEGRGKYPVLGYIDQDEVPFRWDENGEHTISDAFNLINVPEKRVMYVNVYNDNEPVYRCQSRKDADEKECKKRIACIRVEYTEGQFDE